MINTTLKDGLDVVALLADEVPADNRALTSQETQVAQALARNLSHQHRLRLIERNRARYYRTRDLGR